jgi:hypothetical protein
LDAGKGAAHSVENEATEKKQEATEKSGRPRRRAAALRSYPPYPSYLTYPSYLSYPAYPSYQLESPEGFPRRQ